MDIIKSTDIALEVEQKKTLGYTSQFLCPVTDRLNFCKESKSLVKKY